LSFEEVSMFRILLFLIASLLAGCTCRSESKPKASETAAPARDVPPQGVPSRVQPPDRMAPRPPPTRGEMPPGRDVGALGETMRDGDDERAARRAERRAAIDTDGDGQVSEEERMAARQARAADRLSRYDTDGDGAIGEEERAAMRTERAEEIVARFDGDGDGKVSPEEAAAARGRRGRAFQDFATSDTDKDGYLSPGEISAAIQSMRASRRGGADNDADGEPDPERPR
jgi:Ca2+-binding EF-hand superfamily protein